MRNGGRRDRRLTADVAPRVPAAVAELDRGFRAAAMNLIDQPTQAWQEAVVIDAELVASMPPGPFRRRHLDRDQACAAAHAGAVIGERILGDMAFGIGEPRRHRRHDDAVLDLDIADTGGGEEDGHVAIVARGVVVVLPPTTLLT